MEEKKKRYRPKKGLQGSRASFLTFIEPVSRDISGIKGYGVGNFKSWKKSELLNLSRINLIYGQNSSGKSALIQSILSASKHTGDLAYSFSGLDTKQLSFVSPTFDVGSYGHAHHSPNPDGGIKIFFTVETEGSSLISFDFEYIEEGHKGANLSNFKITFSNTPFNLRTRHLNKNKTRESTGKKYFGKLNGSITGKSLSMRVIEKYFGEEAIASLHYDLNSSLYFSDLEKGFTFEIPQYDRLFWNGGFSESVGGNRLEPSLFGLNKRSPKMHSDYPFASILERATPTAQQTLEDRNLNLLSLILRQSLYLLDRGIIHIPPVRGVPKRSSTVQEMQSSDPSVSYIYRKYFESKIHPSQRKSLMLFAREVFEDRYRGKTDPEMRNKVNRSLKSFGKSYKVDVDESNHLGTEFSNIVLKEGKNKKDLTLLDVGKGISQLLPILVSAHGEVNRTILVEQPELHIHPKMQADIADLFIESDNQWIIESHSENLLLRIQRRIREGELDPDQVKLFYIEKNKEGSAEVIDIEFLADGNLSRNFPKGFFDVGLEELMS